MTKLLKLKQTTIDLLNSEFNGIPDKYQKFFNSPHEGLGVLREEYMELENEIFFGEKRAKEDYMKPEYPIDRQLEHEKQFHNGHMRLHKDRIRLEAIQVAAMAIRIAQELTD